LLLLNAAAAQRPTGLVLTCSDSAARWHAAGSDWRSVAIDEQDGLVEGALDALQERLRSLADEAAVDVAPPSVEEQAESPRPRSEPSKPLEPPPAPAPRAPTDVPTGPIGGVGLGIATERWSAFGNWALGPRLDLGVGRGALALRLYESTLLSHTAVAGVEDGYRLLLFDVGASVHWGAPFVPGAPLGAHAGLALEWFAARGAPSAPRVDTRFVPEARLGAVAALPFSRFSLWGGIDGAYRLSDTTLPVPVARGLPTASITASVGALVLAN
jgi:hypothetical protein